MILWFIVHGTDIYVTTNNQIILDFNLKDNHINQIISDIEKDSFENQKKYSTLVQLIPDQNYSIGIDIISEQSYENFHNQHQYNEHYSFFIIYCRKK